MEWKASVADEARTARKRGQQKIVDSGEGERVFKRVTTIYHSSQEGRDGGWMDMMMRSRSVANVLMCDVIMRKEGGKNAFCRSSI